MTPEQRQLDNYLHGLIEAEEIDIVQLSEISDSDLADAMARGEGVAQELNKEDDR